MSNESNGESEAANIGTAAAAEAPASTTEPAKKAKTKAATAPRPQAASKAAAPKPDPAELRRMADHISARVGAGPEAIEVMIGELMASDGLRVRTTADGQFRVKMHGIEAGGRDGDRELALRNWGNAARRQLLETEV